MNWVSQKLQLLIKNIVVVILSMMVVISFAQIIGRYVFFYSLPWSEELSVYLFIWLIFLAASISIKEKSEIRIDIINIKDEKKKEWLALYRNIAALVAISIFLASSVMLTRNTFSYSQLSSSLRINMGYIYLAMPIGFTIMLFETFLNTLENLKIIVNNRNTLTEERGTKI